jgi:hypothetical protein
MDMETVAGTIPDIDRSETISIDRSAGIDRSVDPRKRQTRLGPLAAIDTLVEAIDALLAIDSITRELSIDRSTVPPRRPRETPSPSPNSGYSGHAHARGKIL